MRILTVSAAVTLTAGTIATVGTAASAAPITTTRIGYTCDFPSGGMPVGVAVAAAFPSGATAGRPFRPTGVRTSVTVPHAALADLGDATSVTAHTQLTVKVTQDGQEASAAWLGDAPATPVPDTGDLAVIATGDVPAVTVHGTGPVVFTAASLTLTLTPGGSGQAVDATCTPATGQDTVLARVPASGGAGASPSSSASSGSSAPERTSPSGTASPGTGQVPATPGAAPKAATAGGVDKNAYDTCSDPSTYGAGVAQGTNVSGLANVDKVRAAAVVGYPEPAFVRNTEDGLKGAGHVPINGSQYYCGSFTGDLDHDGKREFPMTGATTSAFGFVPVSATAHLSQVGDAPLSTVVYQDQKARGAVTTLPYTVVATASISLRLSDVRINGVPLDVGQDCRTSRPLYTPDSPADPDNDRVALTGGDAPGDPEPIFSQLIGGGSVAGAVTIPPFTGCVTPSGDDLDRLLTATISGPGNQTKLTAGLFCAADPTCDKQELRPGLRPNWTLTHGGAFAVSGPWHLRLNPNSSDIGPIRDITCGDVKFSGTAFNRLGAQRGDIAQLHWKDFQGCADDLGDSWQIKQIGTAGFSALKLNILNQPGTVGGRGIVDFLLTRTTGQRCSATIAGPIGVIYDNNAGTMEFREPANAGGVGEQLSVTASDCTDIPGNEPDTRTGSLFVTVVHPHDDLFQLPSDQAFTITQS